MPASKKRIFTALLTGLLALATQSCIHAASPHSTFANDPKAEQFIQAMVSKHGFDKDELTALFARTHKRDDILKAISRPAERKPWYEYRPIFLTPSRIDGGVAFWKQNADILKKVEQAYAVDAAVVVAIVGVETRYGGNTGSFRVIDALSTLGFAYPPRSQFFSKELEQFLVLSREEQIKLESARGSYAGAMGLGQFMPSSYRQYAVDMDKDGRRDLWDNMQDILGSVANYLHKHGWKLHQPVARRAELDSTPPPQALLKAGLKPEKTARSFRKQGIRAKPPVADETRVALLSLEQKNGPEYWLTMNNFYVITRYNRSPLYAMAVYQLSEAIREAYEQARLD